MLDSHPVLPPATMKETRTLLTARQTLMVRKMRSKRMPGPTTLLQRKKASRLSRPSPRRRRIRKRKFSTV